MITIDLATAIPSRSIIHSLFTSYIENVYDTPISPLQHRELKRAYYAAFQANLMLSQLFERLPNEVAPACALSIVEELDLFISSIRQSEAS